MVVICYHEQVEDYTSFFRVGLAVGQSSNPLSWYGEALRQVVLEAKAHRKNAMSRRAVSSAASRLCSHTTARQAELRGVHANHHKVLFEQSSEVGQLTKSVTNTGKSVQNYCTVQRASSWHSNARRSLITLSLSLSLSLSPPTVSSDGSEDPYRRIKPVAIISPCCYQQLTTDQPMSH